MGKVNQASDHAVATLVVSESDLKTFRIVYVKSVASLSNGFFDRIEWLAIFY